MQTSAPLSETAKVRAALAERLSGFPLIGRPTLPHGDRIARVALLTAAAGGYRWMCPRLRLFVGDRVGDTWAYGRLA